MISSSIGSRDWASRLWFTHSFSRHIWNVDWVMFYLDWPFPQHAVLGCICIRLRKKLESKDWMPIATWIFRVRRPDWCHDLHHRSICRRNWYILWRSVILARLPFISVVFLCRSYRSKKQLDGRYETKVEASNILVGVVAALALDVFFKILIWRVMYHWKTMDSPSL